MRKAGLFILFSVFVLDASAQNFGISPSYSFDIRKKVEPPILEFVEPPRFIDADGNHAINGNEKSRIEFKLKNSGKGDALNLNTSVKASGSTNGISFKTSEALPKIDKLGGVLNFSIDITSDITTVDGNIELSLEIEEPNGFNSDMVSLSISTRKFLEPKIRVVDYVVYSETGSTSLQLKKPFTLQLLVQNIGQGVAKNSRLNLVVPENVFITSGDLLVDLSELNAGERRSIEYELIINAKYTSTTLPINVKLSESYGKFSEDWNQSFALNQALAQSKIVIPSGPERFVDIETASLRSDVDKEIPKGLPTNSKKYALIIGCEEYAKFQTGLDKEVNVDFAANDARIFSEYARLTLGYPLDQIYTLIDPTATQIKQNLNKLVHGIEIEKGQAEVLIYYSGHGLPDEKTGIPYLIPVDVNGNNPQDGISLSYIYQKLALFPSKKSTLILDACFSGGARNKELVALKGVRIKPKTDAIPGNLVVFSSSKGTESSAVFREKQHGYFTYYFLKNLKENAANNTYKELFDDVNYKVSKDVLKIGKTQTPEVLTGETLGDGWQILKW